jgi:4a-hydroxytetrahydrobiopterin dehydratase
VNVKKKKQGWDNMEKLYQMHFTPASAQTTPLKGAEIERLMPELPGWEIHKTKGELHLEKIYSFHTFAEALAFTNRVGNLANKEVHHPAILTEWGKVTITWWSHRIKTLSMNDMIMAAKTERLFNNLRPR